MRKLDLHFSELQLFRIFRVAFGLLLFSHFLLLFGHLELLFSEKFLANDFAGSLNVLTYTSDGPSLNFVNFIACLLSLFVFANFHRRTVSFILLYVHYCYLHKNPMILNVSYDYLGWLLLALIFIPTENKTTNSEEWRIPTYIWFAGWLIFGLGYTLNGILKIQSPLWRDGTALSVIIPNDRLLANELVRQVLMALPPWMIKGLTWMTAYAELLCLPMIAFKSSRQLIWLVILLLHISALIIFKIKDLSLIMIFFSLFLGTGLQRGYSAIDLLRKASK